MNLAQALDVMLRTHTSALALGVRANSVEMKSGPGLGKSSMVWQYARTLARMLNQPVGLVVEMPATYQSVDVRGFMIPQKAADGSIRPVTVFSIPPWYPSRQNVIILSPDGSELLPPHDSTVVLPDVGIVDLDEFGQAEDDVKKALAELILNGRVGTDRLPIGWRVVAASNRLTDRSGVLRPLAFMTNRRLELAIDAHLPTWNDWVNHLPAEARPHYLTVSFAHKHPDLVFRDAVPPGDAPFCTPRTLILMDRDLQALRSPTEITEDRLPMDNVAREVCAGWIGGGESAQFFTYIKYADLIPDIADVEASPMTAKLPEGRDAQMVVAFMLAHNLTKKNAMSLLKYITRLHIELQVLAMRQISDAEDRRNYAVNTKEWGSWLLAHKDLLLASHA